MASNSTLRDILLFIIFSAFTFTAFALIKTDRIFPVISDPERSCTYYQLKQFRA